MDKEVLITFLKRYFSKIWCFTDHSQCSQSYRWPTSAFQIAASKDSSTRIPKAEDPAMGKGTIRISKPEVRHHHPHVGQGQEDRPPSKIVADNRVFWSEIQVTTLQHYNNQGFVASPHGQPWTQHPIGDVCSRQESWPCPATTYWGNLGWKLCFLSVTSLFVK